MKNVQRSKSPQAEGFLKLSVNLDMLESVHGQNSECVTAFGDLRVIVPSQGRAELSSTG